MKTKLLKRIRKYYLVKYNIIPTNEIIPRHFLLNTVTEEVMDYFFSVEKVIMVILYRLDESIYYEFKKRKDKIKKRKEYQKYINLDIPQKF